MTEAEEEQEIRGVIPNYYVLITDKLNKIYDAWDKNNVELALNRALKLVPFLPRKLKKQLAEEKQKIQSMLGKAQAISGFDCATLDRERGVRVRITAHSMLENFIDKITTLLDEAGLLTQSGQPITEEKFAQLEKEGTDTEESEH